MVVVVDMAVEAVEAMAEAAEEDTEVDSAVVAAADIVEAVGADTGAAVIEAAEVEAAASVAAALFPAIEARPAAILRHAISAEQARRRHAVDKSRAPGRPSREALATAATRSWAGMA